MPPPLDAPSRLRALADAWAPASANERASFQPWMLRFCEALGVAAPDPPTDDYRFELPVAVIDREGRQSTNFIDCWKARHFALEAKAFGEGLGNDALLRKAYGQVRYYVAHVSGDPPPYLMVVDVPRTLIVWDRWSGAYGDFAAGRRIALATLHERPDDIALLHDIFTQPRVRDPRGQAQLVTKEIAGELAELAAELESRGLETERVARFLMRCVFSSFAEDVGLLPANLFRRTLETARRSEDPEHLARALTSLWKTMDEGGMYGAELLHRFNGHFFKTVEALPLELRDIELLIKASKHDWSKVEPSIFGTLLDYDEAQDLLTADPHNALVVRPFMGGRELLRRPKRTYVIDFGSRTEEEAARFQRLYGLVVDRVKPVRDANRDRGIRQNWWRFHRIRGELREAIARIPRFIVTVETSKHRIFAFLGSSIAPDHTFICIATDRADHLGILSSTIHITWALAAGGRLGVGNDPRYNKLSCFEPFPLPSAGATERERIAALAESLQVLRDAALAADDRVTMTGMYNVVEKLRSGEPLTPTERTIHEIAACGVLRDLHDELDALVAEAYGWPWPMEKEEILERLVALHDERVEEEKRGIIRWLRPDYQIPRFAPEGIAPTLELEHAEKPAVPVVMVPRIWPTTAVEQPSHSVPPFRQHGERSTRAKAERCSEHLAIRLRIAGGRLIARNEARRAREFGETPRVAREIARG